MIVLPFQTESRQVLSQAVSVVGDLLGLTRDIEQFTASLRKRATALANRDHFRELNSIEEVTRSYSPSHTQRTASMAMRPSVPRFVRSTLPLLPALKGSSPTGTKAKGVVSVR
jgi:hypothetical protein